MHFRFTRVIEMAFEEFITSRYRIHIKLALTSNSENFQQVICFSVRRIVNKVLLQDTVKRVQILFMFYLAVK